MRIRGTVRSIGTRIAVAAIAGLLVLAAVSSEASAQAAPLVIHGEVRQIHVPGVVVSIAATTVKPYGTVLINGQRLTIDCLKAGFYAGATYSLLMPVVYETYVLLNGRLPNGQRRWVAIGSFAGALTVMAVKSHATRGQLPCGTPWDAPLAAGYLVVV